MASPETVAAIEFSRTVIHKSKVAQDRLDKFVANYKKDSRVPNFYKYVLMDLETGEDKQDPVAADFKLISINHFTSNKAVTQDMAIQRLNFLNISLTTENIELAKLEIANDKKKVMSKIRT